MIGSELEDMTNSRVLPCFQLEQWFSNEGKVSPKVSSAIFWVVKTGIDELQVSSGERPGVSGQTFFNVQDRPSKQSIARPMISVVPVWLSPGLAFQS